MTQDTMDAVIRIENYLESKFGAFADDLITEGYTIHRSSVQYHAALMEFMYDAMEHIMVMMIDNPKGDDETTESYVGEMVDEYADTMMDDRIREILNEYFGE